MSRLDLQRLRGQIDFARAAFWNDGASGETVHALANEWGTVLEHFVPVSRGGGTTATSLTATR